MKVTLVYPDIRTRLRLRTKGYFYSGLACISAALKEAGHSVSLLHYLSAPSRDEFCADLEAQAPDLLAFSSTTNLFGYVRQWASWARQTVPDLTTLCGGVHVTLNPQESLATTELDAICRGEGEEAVAEFCQRLAEGKDAGDVANVWSRGRDGEIRRTPQRPLVADLSKLPLPDRGLFEPARLNTPSKLVVMASRGCPYSCTYCCNRALRDLSGPGHYVRFRAPDHVMREIQLARALLPDVDGVIFDDDIFGLRMDWLRDFIPAYTRGVALPFKCNMRPNLVTPELVALLAQGGCVEVAMGVESGNGRIRNEVLGRRLSAEQISRAFRLFAEAGIRTCSYNMVGLPHENMRNCLETVKFNAALKPDWRMSELNVSIFYPYVGTPLFDECAKHGWLTDRDTPDYADDTILSHDQLSRSQIRFMAYYFRPLTGLYAKLGRCRWPPARRLEAALDRVLCSQAAQLALLPAANAFFSRAVGAARRLRLWSRVALPERALAGARPAASTVGALAQQAEESHAH